MSFLQALPYWPRTYLIVGLAAFAIGLVAVPLATFVLRRFGVMDAVQPNKIHRRAVPRGGGVAIFAAFAIAVLLPGYRSDALNGILLGAFVCMLVGLADDLAGGIPGIYKLFVLCAVTLVLYRFGVRVKLFGDPPLDLAFTMLWIVGVTSAFNGLDNMDGLASGTAAIVASMFFAIAVQAWLAVKGESSLAWFGMLAIALVGANLAFLVYNFNPAKIFMGDSGSFFLGFTLAALGVLGEWNERPLIAATIPVLILGVPIFDFTYVLAARIWRGETRTLREVIDHCAPDHLSHRLTWIGFSQRKAVLFVYLVSIALGISGVLLRNSSSLLDIELALFQGIAFAAIVIILMATAERRHGDRVRHEAALFHREAALPAKANSIHPPADPGA